VISTLGTPKPLLASRALPKRTVVKPQGTWPGVAFTKCPHTVFIDICRPFHFFDMWKVKSLSDRSLNLTLAMAFTFSTLLLTVGVVGILAAASMPDVSNSLQDILNKAHQGPLYTYPTSLTQGIVPVRSLPSLHQITEFNEVLERNPFPQRL
jgi:hypothetical protein